MALLDPSLVGHETRPETVRVTAEDIRAFAEAIGDANPIFFDESSARQAGFMHIPMLPTFITRLRVPFAEAGLDPEHSQVLHAEQEYGFTRPVLAGDTLVGRHRVSSIRGHGNTAFMTLEQLCDGPDGERLVTGRALLLVREMPSSQSTSVGSSPPRSRTAPPTPRDQAPLRLDRQITQDLINAYAEASGDHNPIHLDPEVARAVGLDGTIAHGMLSMAFAGALLTSWLADLPEHGGWVSRLRVRFQGMVRPGDSVRCFGVPGARKDQHQPVELWILNQANEQVITGDAEVIFPKV